MHSDCQYFVVQKGKKCVKTFLIKLLQIKTILSRISTTSSCEITLDTLASGGYRHLENPSDKSFNNTVLRFCISDIFLLSFSPVSEQSNLA